MDFKPLSGRLFPRYSGIKTFFRLPFVDMGFEAGSASKLTDEQNDFSVALFGIPFDGGVSYRPGARFAPSHVREASSLGRGFHWSRGQNLFEKLRIADIGDCQTVPIDLQQTYQKIEAFVSQILENKKKFLAVGGDHSVSLPTLRALKKYYGKPLAFIHFDAHLDTYPAAWGCEFHHGSFARHAIEEGLVNPQKMVQIGLRGPLAGGDDLDFVTRHKVRVITVDDIREKALPEFLKTLPIFDSTPTFVSFDVDCLDPAFAPGTGTPVPGGLTTYEVQRILRALKIPNLVGADLVEICPAYDSSDITALAGVDVMFELLHHLIKS
ncbi:MAG: agmatinase [Bdellovibrionaceae bacterium]|nr:agmatinase [Pseudobdellovibrionaceae bacterium]